jgi:hypothetical protein
MDYDFLRQEGIRHIERLGSQQWTDYNTHDPGITILEQLCYALTDLLYRIDYAIPDILAEGGGDPFANLFGPSQILTTNPVTLQDLRKLLVDIPGVRNAWVERLENTEPSVYFHPEEHTLSFSREDQLEPLALQGIYQIWLEAEPDFGVISTSVTERLHEYRGLTQDFNIKWLEDAPIRIYTTMEIDATANIGSLQHAIYEQIGNYFSPPVRFYSLQECLDAGKPIDEIFEGPYLEHGFIDSQELQAITKRTELRVSDLIRLLMDIPGVRAVQHLEFAGGEKWLLRLDGSKVPKLDKNSSEIILIQGDVKIPLLPADGGATVTPPTPMRRELPLPASQNRHIGDDYYSIQQQFPDTYGINSNGLPASASPLRQARAKQLKAYLLLFDQLLANHFAQLANVGRLFSFAAEDNDLTTYFSRILDDPTLWPDGNAPDPPGLWTAPDRDTRRANLEKLVNNPDNRAESLERKNRFLNHLLARFAEHLADYTAGAADTLTQQIARKQAYLNQYAELGQRRNTAANYRKAADSAKPAGLEQRIRLKLGLDDAADFYLIEHILLRPLPGDQNQRTPVLELKPEIQHGDPYSLQLSVILPASLQFLKQPISDDIPAHLSAYFPQLDDNGLANFKTVCQNWQQAMSDTSTNHQVLRAARDRLIDLLGFGHTYPLSDLEISDEMVAYGEKANIRISFSQADVLYQLCEEDGTPMDGFTVTGNGGEALLTTPPITEDKTYKILACKTINADHCTDTPYKTFLEQTASIKVGLNTSLEAEIIRETDATGNNPLAATLLAPHSGIASPTAARLSHFDHRVEVEVRASQEGVKYRLFPAKDDSLPALSGEITGEGSGHAITIQSQSMAEDTDIRIRAAKTIHVLGNGDEQVNWLDTVLALRVRASTDLAVTATPAPILAFGASPTLRVQATQTSAHYQAFQHTMRDADFVFGTGHEGLLTIPVTGYPDVQGSPPAWQAIWTQVPEGYAASGSATQGNGGQLDVTLAPLHEDSLIVLQAEKQHQEGNQTIPSAVQLRQTVMLLVEPDPEPALTLRIHSVERTAHSLQVANGQTGVFYHFRLAAEGEEISQPAYFHQWANGAPPENKGINQLRIEGDFVITATQNPQTPVVDLLGELPDNATLHIRARKARTNVASDLKHTVTLPPLPEITAPQTVTAGSTATIQVHSKIGERYQWWLNEQMLAPEMLGNDNLLEFTTPPVTETSRFTLRSIHTADSGMNIEFDQTVLITVQPT